MEKTMGTDEAAWKQLLLYAIESNSSLERSSFVQLATIGTNGRPSNRTVIFRGFEGNNDKIQIHSDIRSRKIEELKHCPFAEICWYFTDSWEQFRISGRIDVIDGSNPNPMKLQQREKAWFDRTLEQRLYYLGSTPGLPCTCEESNHEASLDNSAGPLFEFCLLILDPDRVDFYTLKGNRRLIFSSTASVTGEKCWTSERVNP